MMAAATSVMGIGTGKRLLTSSTFVCHADLSDKHSSGGGGGGGGGGDGAGNIDQGIIGGPHIMFAANSNPNRSSAYFVKALRCHHTSAAAAAEMGNAADELESDDDEVFDLHSSVEALLLLQKSMLEKQWTLPFVGTAAEGVPGNARARPCPHPDPNLSPTPKAAVTCSGTSARQRRMSAKRKIHNTRGSGDNSVSPQLLQARPSGYVKGAVTEQLLSHAEVVQLSKFIQVGLNMEDHKSRLKERLGCEPSNEQLAAALRMSHAELQSKLMECSLAREKLAMSNVRLVMSIAQKYNGMGAEMADLVQGGLVGLLRGIEKFDSSKGFKISTYVYWWIRQGVASALVDNARTLRLPKHLHERLSLIKYAKIALEEKGIVPSIDKIAESLNMSKKKVKNATEAVSQVFSLDRQAFPSLSGIPGGETLHSYIADNRSENDPWHGVGDWALKDEVNNLLDSTLGARERDIIRLYYGLDSHPLSWEDISKRIGLSRERVRQVGLVAMEKLKHAARKRRLEAMLVTH